MRSRLAEHNATLRQQNLGIWPVEVTPDSVGSRISTGTKD